MNYNFSMNINYDFDLIIVGAGPAGSSLALLLPETIKILVIDKSSFPRDKICGECLSPGAIDIIKEIGLEKIFIENHVEKIYGVTFKSPNLKTQTVLYPDDHYGYAIPRTILDKTLVDKVKERNNIEIIENFTFNDIEISDNKVLLKGKTKEKNYEFIAKMVVGADGRYSTLANKLNMYQTNKESNRHVYVATLNNFKGLENTIELEIKSKEIQYLVSKQDDDVASVAVVINNDKFDKKSFNADSYFNLLAQSEFIKNRAENSTLESKLKGMHLNKYKLKSLVSDRLVFIGDSTGFIDPITGEGMFRAFKTSKIASEVIKKAILNNDYSEIFLKQYQTEVLKEFESIYFFIKTAVFLTTNELVANTVVNNMSSMKELGEKLVSLQGAIIPAKEIFSLSTFKLFVSLLKKQMVFQSIS